MKILEINTTDTFGGAEQVAVDLLKKYIDRGIDAKLGVRWKHSDEPAVFELDVIERSSPLSKLLYLINEWISQIPHFRGKNMLREWLSLLSCPARFSDRMKGVEDFNYPVYYLALAGSSWKPDLIHCHNLHRNYFNLKTLEILKSEVPIVLTLHDTWTFTGHCAYFIDCQSWKTGCVKCSYLERPVAIRKDMASINWKYKKEIYDKSALFVATPSKWLMDQVDQSILKAVEKRVIHNGVDLKVFNKTQKADARKRLGLPTHRFIALHVSAMGRGRSEFKDYPTVEKAIKRAKHHLKREDELFICIGGDDAEKETRNAEVFFPRTSDRDRLALFYNAADVFLHAANAENLPLTVLEAQACGTPVIATAVGGVPECVEDGVTGFLVSRADSEAMAARLVEMAKDGDMVERMGNEAEKMISRSFSLDQQVEGYISWYKEIIEGFAQGDFA